MKAEFSDRDEARVRSDNTTEERGGKGGRE